MFPKCVPGVKSQVPRRPSSRIWDSELLTLSKTCLECDVGRTTLDATGSTSCTICAAGTYGLGCKNCEVGQYRTGGDDGTSGKREKEKLILNVI